MHTQIEGIWLNTSETGQFPFVDFIVFDTKTIQHLTINDDKKELTYKASTRVNSIVNITEVNLKHINEDRIRFYKKGRKHTVLSETEYKDEETIFEEEYVRLFSTNTTISENEIILSKYTYLWNGESGIIAFNTILDAPHIQEANKSMNIEGTKMRLEKIAETIFVSIFHNKQRHLMLPIKTITTEKIVLYGFPKEPYYMVGKRIH